MEQFAISVSLFALTVCLVHAGWLAICLYRGRHLAASSLITACLLSATLAIAVATNWAASDAFPFPAASQVVVLLGMALWVGLRFGWTALPRGSSVFGRGPI